MFLHLCITCEIFSTFLTHRVLNGAFFAPSRICGLMKKAKTAAYGVLLKSSFHQL